MVDEICEKIFNEREFVKFVTAVRHEIVHVIYAKQNFFQQSRQ